MPAYLGLDVLATTLLLVVPWRFGFSGGQRAVYTAIGLFESLVILTSRTTPATEA